MIVVVQLLNLVVFLLFNRVGWFRILALRGKTFDGTPVQGTDSICIVP